ncbi:MAG: gliding motility-associated C-terminal domain-containing protein [Flavobacteriales bacterium]|nr:gliding motility-associated C-terminal domain-containing protein [Flavobacteriales bacterium]
MDTLTNTVTEPLLALRGSWSSVTLPNCYGQPTGKLTILASGGTTPYKSYAWSSGTLDGTNDKRKDLAAGVQVFVTITDNNNCTTVKDTILTSPDSMKITSSQVNVKCKGGNTGSITVTVNGGTSPYVSYSWSGTGSGTTTRTGLVAGSYTVTITDSKTCTKDTTITITEPVNGLTGTPTLDQVVTCKGGSDGKASVVPSGGTGPYSYAWSKGTVDGSNDKRKDLTAGFVKVTITDANFCTRVDSVNITEPALGMTGTLNITQQVLCKGDATGKATAIPSGGTTPYSYNWSSGSVDGTNDKRQGLSAGLVSVTVTDFKGCLDTLTNTVTEPGNLLSVTLGSKVNPTCVGTGNNGSIKAVAAGGTLAYKYSWNTVNPNDTLDTLGGLTAGIVRVTVTDANGCTATAFDTLFSPGNITVSIDTIQAPRCNGFTNGVLQAIRTGGSGPFGFVWTAKIGNARAGSSGTIWENTGADTISVEMIDSSNMCRATHTAILAEPDTLFVNPSMLSPVSCKNGSNGVAKAIPTGGTPTYKYQWNTTNPNDTLDTIAGLTAGFIKVTVTDDSLCTQIDSVEITEPGGIVDGILTVSDVKCKGDTTGFAVITAKGGTSIPIVRYSWSSGDTLLGRPDSAFKMFAGIFNVTVFDANNCSNILSDTVKEPLNALSVTLGNKVNPTCVGTGSNGSIKAVATGGTSPYKYQWNTLNPSDTLDTLGGQAARIVRVTVTDANGCQANSFDTLFSPGNITVSLDTVQAILCNGLTNGVLAAVRAGGTGPFGYVWTAKAGNKRTGIDSIWENTGADTIGVELIDSNNMCRATSTAILVQPDSVSISIVEVLPIQCSGDSANLRAVVTGGTRPYNYNWNNVGISGGFDSLRNKVPAGTYSIVVKDVNLCLDTILPYTVSSPSTLAGTLFNDTVPCFGDTTGIGRVVATGGVGNYRYQWSAGNGGLLDSISRDIRSGLFSVTVTDNGGAGCNLVLSDTIHSPDSIYGVFSNIVQPGCGGSALGSLVVTPFGGTPNYTSYTWNGVGATGATDSIRINLPIGLVAVVIEDSKGCKSDSVKFTMAAPGNTNPSFTTISNPNCAGDSTGKLIVTPTGGTPGYTYQWLPASLGVMGITDSIRDSLPSGVLISVIVTDNNGFGCSDTISTTLGAPTTLSVAFSNAINPSCFGSSDGSLTANGSGGNPVPSYTYSWKTGVTTPTGKPNVAINLAGGVFYPVTVTDGNGCTASDSVMLTNPAALTATFTDSTKILCNGKATGQLIVTPGTPGFYTYFWSGSDGLPVTTGAKDSIAVGLKANVTYTVRVVSGACSTTVSKILSQPTAMSLFPFPPFAGAATCGDNNGVLFVRVTGGTPKPFGPPPTRYDYAWDSAGVSMGGNTPNLTNLYAGSYNVVVTDANGCTATFTGNVSDRGAPIIRLDSVVDATCPGVCDGGIYTSELLVLNPKASYKWSNNDTTPDLLGVCSGKYTVTVTDTAGCKRILSGTVDNDTSLSLSFTQKALSCNSTVCDGQATVIPLNGVGPYSYLWSSLATDTLATAKNLCAGKYKTTVTDKVGCSAVDSVTLLSPSNISITTNSDSVICNGDASGVARVANVTGGKSPYSYKWSTGVNDTLAVKNGVGAGTYYVTVREAGGCDKIDTVVVAEPALISATFVIQAANCGVSDGKVTATPSGGSGSGYNYNWPVGGAKISNIDSGYGAGTFNVLVKDGKGCGVSVPFNVGNINGPIATLDSIKHEKCFGQCDGGIFISVSGGNTPFNYQWTPTLSTPKFQNQDLDSVCAGIYNLRIQDQKNCIGFFTDTIDAATAIKSNIAVLSKITKVGNCDGIAAVYPSGGVGPYNVVWSDRNSSITDTISLLCDSLYKVTITDKNGCQIMDSIEVRDPLVIVLDSVRKMRPTCATSPCDGKLKIFVSGGNGSYKYTWDNSDTTDSTVNRCAGVINVTVTDGTVSSVFKIPLSDTSASVIDVDSINTKCNGSTDGKAWAFLVSGAPISKWNWPALGVSTDTAFNLTAGLHSVQATNTLGCVSADTIRVNEPTIISASFIKTQPNCTLSNGQMIAIATGGTPSYSFTWLDAAKALLSPSQTMDTVKNIPSGIYFVRITDKNSCVQDVQVTLNDKNAATITIDSIKNVTCNGICDGAIFVSATGGTGTLKYKWDQTNSIGLDTIQDIDSACAGIYTLTVTDGSGCKSLIKDTIVTADSLQTKITIGNHASSQGVCDGSASVVVVGGKSPYKYNWTNSGSSNLNTTLCAGTHIVTVTDDKGCIAIDTTKITEPITIKIIKVDTIKPNCGKCDGKVKITVAGGQSPYTYKWDNNDTTDSTVNRCAGILLVTVTDANLLSKVFVIGLGNKNGPVLSVVTTDATCFGSCDGTVSASATGGTPSYRFDWPTLGKLNTANVSGVCAGGWLAQVTDAKGCITIDSAKVGQPGDIIGVATATLANCGKADGGATLAVAGGIGALTYKWSNATTTTVPTITGLSAGAYSVTIEDTKPCSSIVSFNVNNPGGPLVVIDTVINEKCINSCDGRISTTASGTVAPYKYEWSPGSFTSDDITGLCGGVYTLKVTDAAQCATLASDTVKSPASPVLGVTVVSHVSSFGKCDAKAYVSTTNPVGMNYTWSSGEIGDTAKKLCAGYNFVTVTSPTGCRFVDSVLVIQPSKMIVNSLTTVNPQCNVCDGQLKVVITGGTPPYTYKWDNSDKTDSTSKRCAGLITLVVTDSKNYSEKFSFTLNNTIKPGISTSSTDVACFGSCSGSGLAVGKGISGPFTYNWPTLGVKKDSVKNLCAGTYFVEVKDKIGCLAVDSITINEPEQLGVRLNKTLPTCNISNGFMKAAAFGGTPKNSGYGFRWLDNIKLPIIPDQTSDQLINVSAGLYHIVITDSLNCTDTLEITLNNIGGASITLDSIKTVTCKDGCDGFLSSKAIASGPVKYLWFPGEDTTKSISNLCAGAYTIQITDTSNCKSMASYTIANPEGFNVVMRSIEDATCSNTNDGSISTIIVGEAGNLNYKWSGPDSFNINSPIAANIVAGEYGVTATDEFGCSASTKDSVRVHVQYTVKAHGDTNYCGLPSGHLVYVSTNNKQSYVTTWYDGTGNILGKLDTLNTSLNLGNNLIIAEVRESICVEYDTVKVFVQESFKVDAGPDRTIVTGQTTTLGGEPTAPTGTKIVWTPTTFISATNVQNPTVSPKESITYTVYVDSEIGCNAKDTVRVTVDDRIKVNSGFSPNGDGVNDVWELALLKDFPDASVKIFNRWGQLLYNSEPYVPWDGTFNDEPMSIGTYYYVIDLKAVDLENPIITGPLTIIR